MPTEKELKPSKEKLESAKEQVKENNRQKITDSQEKIKRVGKVKPYVLLLIDNICVGVKKMLTIF